MVPETLKENVPAKLTRDETQMIRMGLKPV